MRRTYRRRVQKPTGPQYRMNDRIMSPEVRVIDENGASLGVMSIKDAIERARVVELDLVEVFPRANPPVAKILDYNQFKYQKDKETQKAKAKQKKQEIKGVRLSFRIGEHDLANRLNQASKFLDGGHKLKVELQLRGRENRHKDLAATVISQFVDRLKEKYEITVEQPVQKQGNRLSLICFSTGRLQKKIEERGELEEENV